MAERGTAEGEERLSFPQSISFILTFLRLLKETSSAQDAYSSCIIANDTC